MRFEMPEIYWHGNRERIMSVDFGDNFELVSSGADLAYGIYIRLWEISLTPELNIKHLDSLGGTHERVVNVVRFSPCKNFIASGSDDSCVVIWEKKLKPVFGQDRSEIGWGSKKILRGHSREIHDLCWCGSDKHLVSGSFDGSVIVFDVDKGKVMQRLEGSKPINGVAWSGTLLATMSTDRSLRIYEKGKKGFYIKHCIKDQESVKLFQDEVCSSAYFRRLAFSPDGLFLLTSASEWKGTPVFHCFFPQFLQTPSLSYPVNLTENATVLSIKFCPVLFKSLKSDVFKNIGHKIVWAVACKDSVLVYNSEEISPIYAVTNPHYSSISDITWYYDRVLAISSIDGYVSFVVFAPNELGEQLDSTNSASHSMEIDNEPEPIPQAPQPVVLEKSIENGKKRIVPEFIT